MDISEINKIMSENLKNLKEAADECDEENLADISLAMIQTATFLVDLSDKHFITNQ